MDISLKNLKPENIIHRINFKENDLISSMFPLSKFISTWNSQGIVYKYVFPASFLVMFNDCHSLI